MGLFNFFRQHKKEKLQFQENTTKLISNKNNAAINVNNFESTSNDQNNQLQDNPVLEDGLTYGDILMLNWLNGQEINKKVPGYFVERFQINPLASKQKYKEKGLLISGSVESGLQTLKVTELKKILKENNQKVSGRKSELIGRIKENINKDQYIRDLPKTYGLSDEVLSLLKKYRLLIWASNNEHILSPKDYIPFINSNKKEQEIAIDLLEEYITKLIRQNNPYTAYPLSNAENEIAIFYNLLNDTANYIKHYIYSTLIDYLRVTEIKDDYYTEPFDFNTQYIQTHIIDNLQSQDINKEIVNPIVDDFIKRYDTLLTASFKKNPMLGTEAIVDALVLQPDEYHKKRIMALKRLRNN